MGIRITINGPIAVGKTTIGKLIAKTLRDAGYGVEHLEEPARHPPYLGYMEVQIEETSTPMGGPRART